MIQEVTVRISDLARGGSGVSRDESGRVIFVPYTAPGDLVRARIVKADKRFAHAEIIEILEPAAIREAPRCPIFGKCGGCEWQHLPYSLQWETKVKGLGQVLTRAHIKLLGEQNELLDIEQIPAERIWEYRNRVQLRGLGNQLGFYKSGSNELIFADRCDIARSEINATWEETRAEGASAVGVQRSYKVEVEVTPKGEIRKTWNAPHSASGFRQIHDEQNEKLKMWVRDQMQPAEILYDLFGGSGNFSIPLAAKMSSVHCIDLTVPQMRPLDTPSHLEFHRSSVVPWLLKRSGQFAPAEKAELPGQLRKPSQSKKNKGSVVRPPAPVSAAIIDPPREGLGGSLPEIAAAIEALNVREIVAVGCDPDAWARDVSGWIKRGWHLRRVMAIDLFPQTSHIEAVAILTL
jgi:23S rRNA (uracil1939-C5)-methyltransferase